MTWCECGYPINPDKIHWASAPADGRGRTLRWVCDRCFAKMKDDKDKRLIGKKEVNRRIRNTPVGKKNSRGKND